MSRALTAREITLARSVFADTIDYGRVRLSTRPWGRHAIAFGSHLSFPRGCPVPADFADEGAAMQAWLMHELTHVWQFQTAAGRTLRSWAATAAGGGYGRGRPGYRYTVPLGAWDDYNLEQQASIVEHAFLLRERGVCRAAPEGASFEAYAACLPFDI